MSLKPSLYCKKGHLKTGDNAIQIFGISAKGNRVKDGVRCRQCFYSDLRKRKVKNQYGLDWTEYENLLKVQDYKCAICKTEHSGIRDWSVDHNHVTNQARGLLCVSCNTALGHANDDPKLLRKMADYIERFQ